MGYHSELYHKGLDYVFKSGKNVGKTVEEVCRATPDAILFMAYHPKGPHIEFKKEVHDLVNKVKYPTKGTNETPLG